MTSYRIESQTSSNAYGESFQVIQMEDGEDVYFVGTFTRRCWAEAWITDMMAAQAERGRIANGRNQDPFKERESGDPNIDGGYQDFPDDSRSFDLEDESYRPISDCIPW